MTSPFHCRYHAHSASVVLLQGSSFLVSIIVAPTTQPLCGRAAKSAFFQKAYLCKKDKIGAVKSFC